MWLDACCMCVFGEEHQDALWKDGSVTLWAMFGWENLGSGIHMAVTLTKNTCINIVVDQVNPFMAMVFPYGSDIFLRIIDIRYPATLQNYSGIV